MVKRRVFRFEAEAFIGSVPVRVVEAPMAVSVTIRTAWADGMLHFLEPPVADLPGQ